MFWGMSLTGPKKRMAFMTEEAIRVTNICLEPAPPVLPSPFSTASASNPDPDPAGEKTASGGAERSAVTQLFVISKAQEFLICSLSSESKKRNVSLQLEIDADEEIFFRINGDGTLHFTGYYIPDSEFDSVSTDSGSSGKKTLKKNLNKSVGETAKFFSGLSVNPGSELPEPTFD